MVAKAGKQDGPGGITAGAVLYHFKLSAICWSLSQHSGLSTEF